MPTYKVEFRTPLSVDVTIEADDEDSAADAAWHVAQEYLQTVTGDHRDVRAEATLDGIGEDAINEVQS